MINHSYLEYFNQSSVKKNIDMIYDTNNHILNKDIVSGTMTIEENAFTSQELRFGSLVASKISFNVYNTIENLMDKWLDVKISVNNDTSNLLNIGRYKVVTDKISSNKKYRQIEAYDSLSDIINMDVANWYNGLTFPITLKDFRDSFFEYAGVIQVSTDLVNDSITIEKTISTNILSGQQVLKDICEINGAIGHIDRNGNFAYIRLIANPTSRIVINKIKTGGSYENYSTSPITKVQIKQEANDVGAVVGENGNTYIVQDNFLMYGKTAEELNTIATNLLSVIEGISYTPYSVFAIYGNPCYEIGDPITIVSANTTINSYIFNRTLTGIQSMSDTYKADGTPYYTENVNGINKQITQLKKQTNVLERTVEQTKSTITSIQDMATTADENAQNALNTANGLEERVEKNESSITQQATEIESKVSKTEYTGEEIASLINQTAENIKILAQHIKLEGLTTINDNVKFNEDGTVEINGGAINIETQSEKESKIRLNYSDGDIYRYIYLTAGDLMTSGNQNGKIISTDYRYDGISMVSGTPSDGYEADIYAHGVRFLKTEKLENGTVKTTHICKIDESNGIIAKQIQTTAGADLDTLNTSLNNKADKNWKVAGTGTNVDISNVYNKAYEYWVVFVDSNNLSLQWIIPYQELGKTFSEGYYYSPSYYGTNAINTSKTSISVSSAWTRTNNNGTISTTGTIAVYYR